MEKMVGICGIWESCGRCPPEATWSYLEGGPSRTLRRTEIIFTVLWDLFEWHGMRKRNQLQEQALGLAPTWKEGTVQLPVPDVRKDRCSRGRRFLHTSSM